MKVFIAGNWKMHLTYTDALWLATSIHRGVMEEGYHADIDVMIAPPFIWLQPICSVLRGSPVRVGAQNMYWEEKGAYTGEISPIMLVSAGVQWVILGHSERRHILGETDEMVRKKLVQAIAHGLKPILCVGETLEEREGGHTLDVIRRQVESALDGLSEGQIPVIAYEPVWAIGTGHAATPEQAEEVHVFITELIQSNFSGTTPRILYGGSVNPANIAGFVKKHHVHGALVGGASLKPDLFLGILQNVKETLKNSL